MIPPDGISRAGAEVSGYLDALFERANSGQLGTLFADLDRLAGTACPFYADALDQLHPGTMLAFASQRLAETQAFADGLFNCGDFAGVGALLTKRGCAYLSTIGRATHQLASNAYGAP